MFVDFCWMLSSKLLFFVNEVVVAVVDDDNNVVCEILEGVVSVTFGHSAMRQQQHVDLSVVAALKEERT